MPSAPPENGHRRHKPYSLQIRFMLGLMGILVTMGLFFAASLYMHLNQLVSAEARSKASLILSHAESVQSYVRNTLRPAMYRDLPADRFIIEAMSTSFVTRHVMSDPAHGNEAFEYRRVAIDARNPSFEAASLERGLIERFKADPTLTRIEETENGERGERFITARPVRFEEACMKCHGAPADAPPQLIALYGPVRGFGRSPGELAGIDLVSIAIDESLSSAKEAITSFATLFAVGMVILFAIIHTFFTRLVVYNLRRMGAAMQRQLGFDANGSMLDRLRRDEEIEDVINTMEGFTRQLAQARQQLKDYASNLESMVATRTADLQAEADARSADVGLFVELLAGLNRSQGKHDLLGTSLELIARRFNAASAAYACLLSGTESFSWPADAAPPQLPEDMGVLLGDGLPRLTPRAWYIPVQTTETSRGLLCLFWREDRPHGPRTPELAQALGRQLGIALDNIDVLDNLLRQNTLLDSIFEGISDPLLLLDGHGAIVFANGSAERMAKAIPGGLPRLLDDAGLPNAVAEPAQMEIALEDGRSFVINVYPLAQTHGRNRSVVYLRETTREKRMFDQMRQQEKLASVGRLAAGLAHEINNPLGVIMCYAELLQTQVGDSQARHDLDIILRHTLQAQRVVRDLLDFARPKDTRCEACDINDVLSDIVEIFMPKARKSGVNVSLDLEPDLPRVYADRDSLGQVFSNLLLNALDAVPERTGTIAISTCGKGYGVTVTIRDNGPGIPEAHRDRIFDPFYTTKETGRGTGLGLAVVYGIMRDLNGNIDVSTDDGATFILHFPADGDPRDHANDM